MTLDYATRVICAIERENKNLVTCDMCGEPVQETDEYCKVCGYTEKSY